MAAKLKMPVSTIRYFCEQSYKHFLMTGKCSPSEHKTVHLNDEGNRVVMTVTLYPTDKIAIAAWHGNSRVAGARQLETRQMTIAQSWGF